MHAPSIGVDSLGGVPDPQRFEKRLIGQITTLRQVVKVLRAVHDVSPRQQHRCDGLPQPAFESTLAPAPAPRPTCLRLVKELLVRISASGSA